MPTLASRVMVYNLTRQPVHQGIISSDKKIILKIPLQRSISLFRSYPQLIDNFEKFLVVK